MVFSVKVEGIRPSWG